MKINFKPDIFDISTKKQLNQEIWNGDVLNPIIRERLLDIANEFIESLEVIEDKDIEDIRFTGSLANYNYTSYSDIDLHVIIDFDKLSGEEKFLKSFFKSKKDLWNDQHNITIRGFDVELYVEDLKEKHVSTGVYSISKDKWIKKPSKIDQKIDKKAVLKKVERIVTTYKDLVKEGGTESKYRKLFKKIVDMRRAGLDKGGEYSVENLAFKILRRTGIIKNIVETFKELHDKILTLDEKKLLINDEEQ